MRYHANSLSDIAEHFLSMAATAEKKLATTKPGKAAHILRAEISVWQAAADTLRNTQIGAPAIEPPAKR